MAASQPPGVDRNRLSDDLSQMNWHIWKPIFLEWSRWHGLDHTQLIIIIIIICLLRQLAASQTKNLQYINTDTWKPYKHIKHLRRKRDTIKIQFKIQ